jgi:hypothetical protein
MRRMIDSWLLVSLVTAGGLHAAGPPVPPEPIKGVIVSGNVIACVTDADKYAAAWIQPRDRAQAVEVDLIAIPAVAPLRWHVGHGVLWTSDSWGVGLSNDLPNMERLHWHHLAQLWKGHKVKGPGAKPTTKLETSFAPATPVLDARWIGLTAKFTPVVYYDYLPAGRFSARLFAITNIRGRGRAIGKGGALTARAFSTEVEATPTWSFRCYSVRSKWNTESSDWDHDEWQEECEIEMSFREPFHALARGEDYYFLTASGKLYRAAKPAKGKQRKLEVVWDDWRCPVTAFVSDVATGRTFLFCEGVGKHGLFELAPRARCRHYDAALFKKGSSGPDALKRVVGYTRVLLALKLIKDK